MKKMLLTSLVLALSLALSPLRADSPKASPDVRFSLSSSGDIALCAVPRTPDVSSASDFLSAPVVFIVNGYCSLDCSRCSSNAQCLSRHAGGCGPIPIC